MARKLVISLAILTIAVASLVHSSIAETLVVGDGLGWLVPPGGDLAYAAWGAINIFTVGDVLCMHAKLSHRFEEFCIKKKKMNCFRV